MITKPSETNLRSLISPVQLGKTDNVVGTIFSKQIMSYGTWINPNWWWDEELTMELDEGLADAMIDNFNKKTYGKKISVPLNHTGDVTANVGEVMKLEKRPGGLWAYLDIRDEVAVKKINDGLIFDVSMGFDWDYVSQKDGKHYGPTLIHVALVTDPYLNDMDDFELADNAALSRRFEEYALNTGFGKSQPSIIMMSKDKVEELKRMKFAKVTNDKDYPVEVTYTDADGKEQKQVLEAGAEVEVSTEQEQAVKDQIASAEKAVEGKEETEEERQAREAEEAKAREEEIAKDNKEQEKANEELSKAKAELAELKAEKAYNELLSKGKIVPAQKDLFLSIARLGEMQLSSDVKALKLSKGQNTSLITMLSAILEAGPQVVKLGEQGGDSKDEEKVELSKEQEAKLKRMGFNLNTIKKQLAAGKLTLSEENE